MVIVKFLDLSLQEPPQPSTSTQITGVGVVQGCNCVKCRASSVAHASVQVSPVSPTMKIRIEDNPLVDERLERTTTWYDIGMNFVKFLEISIFRYAQQPSYDCPPTVCE